MPGSTEQVPGSSMIDVFHERLGFVLGQDTNDVNVASCDIAQGKVNNPVYTTEDDRGFGTLTREDIQSGAYSAREQ